MWQLPPLRLKSRAQERLRTASWGRLSFFRSCGGREERREGGREGGRIEGKEGKERSMYKEREKEWEETGKREEGERST